ncbi:Glycosyltransferase, GT2 family [Algoriphagus alkaliphilus]|uniref:Glycosyltransferase, GT2 family n=1 Tax=Algoriphagus alkaliphilus TaxID=279824 RepID=A0A1G5ZNX5_9BACT|nr:glycosyltransferase [Algoriphagus alkaliphilus]SDA96335.1 Glycosyltransferase, GT2 family [Algoriphagus alkaliphilus]
MNLGDSSFAVLLVTFNRHELLCQILRSIQEFNWQVSNFIIVDNGSEDETSLILKEFESSLSLSIISQNENIGHGAGLAVGLDYLKANLPSLEYVVFLEDDSIPTAGYLDFLLAKIQNSTYTMISSSGSLVSLGKRKKLIPSDTEILAADFAIFDGAIVRFQDLLKVGFPVRDWFMMFDDFEYCYRIRKSGFSIGVVANPYLEILHEGWGEGTSHSFIWRTYFQSRNFTLFIKKYFTLFNLLDWLILQSKRLLGGIFLKNGMLVFKMTILGIRAGVLGKTGKSLDLKTLKEI